MDLPVHVQKELLVCYDVANLEKLSRRRAAAILNISLPTLKTLLGNRKSIEERRKPNTVRADHLGFSVKKPECRPTDDLEKCLYEWYISVGPNPPVSDDVLLDTARGLSSQLGVRNFLPSDAWLTQWKTKHNVPSSRRTADFFNTMTSTVGAEKSSPGSIHVPVTYDLAREVLANAMYNYDNGDVYSLVETGLYYETVRNWTVGYSGPTPVAVGSKQVAKKLSVLFVSNVTGTDKKRPLVMDNSDDPQLVEDVKTFFDGHHGNPGAWLVSSYASFLKKWDEDVSPRKILLVLDNRSTYPVVELKNIEIKYLPKSTVHPLGLSIVQIAKTCEYYQNQLKSMSVGAVNSKNSSSAHVYCNRNCDILTMSDSLDLLVDAWQIVSPELVRNCFRIIGFIRSESENDYINRNLEYWTSRKYSSIHKIFGFGDRQTRNENYQKLPRLNKPKHKERMFGCEQRTMTMSME